MRCYGLSKLSVYTEVKGQYVVYSRARRDVERDVDMYGSSIFTHFVPGEHAFDSKSDTDP